MRWDRLGAGDTRAGRAARPLTSASRGERVCAGGRAEEQRRAHKRPCACTWEGRRAPAQDRGGEMQEKLFPDHLYNRVWVSKELMW